MPRALFLLPVLSLVLPLLAGCGEGMAAAAPTDPAASASATGSPPEPVVAGPPARKTLVLTTTQPARIEAFEETPLFAKVSGYVGEVLVDIGDRVEKGQLLVRLDVPELMDDRRQKQALVAQANADVGQSAAARKAAEAALNSARAGIEQAKAGIARAEAEYQRWQAESTRLDTLADSGTVTQKLADETRNQYRAADAARREAAASVDAAEAAIGEAAAGVEKANADIVAAEARLAVAEANLAQVETMLGYTEINAPFAGVVTRRNVDTGHFVANGGSMAPLLAVVRADRVRVFLDVPEVEAARVDVGDTATVRVQALDGIEVEGAVTRSAWALNESNRALRTEIDLDNPDGRLRPGMYATAAIRLETREDVPTLPVAAVARQPAGTCCFVIRDGKAVRTPITLGLRVGADFEVVSGLSGEETVALAKAETLKDGQAVEPTAPAAP